MDVTTQVTVAFFISLGLALLLTPLARLIGLQYGWTSRPRPDRWGVAPRGKPLLGGAAVFAAFWISLIVVAHSLPGWGWKILFGGGAAFALIGFLDDRFEFRPSTKVFSQMLAALLPVFLGLRIPRVAPVLTEILAVGWIIIIVNAVNLLDNMDGLAAGVTAITAAFLAYHGYSNGQLPMLLAGVCLAGACLGFLRYNFPPSTVYMGDAGSHFLGYTLAVLCLLSLDGTRRTVAATFLVPVLVLLVPIFDTALVALTRFANGRSVTRGAADHSSHRLVSLGLSERGTALLTYALALVGGVLSLAAPRLSLGIVAVSVLFVSVALYYFGTFLSHAPIYSRDVDLSLARKSRLAFFDAVIPYKWATLDVLADAAVIAASYTAAYLLRYEGELTPYNAALLERSLPILLACRLIAFRSFGLYRKVHEHMGISDVIDAAKAIALSSAAFVFILVALYRFWDYSRAVLIIDAALTFGLVIATRTSLSFFQDLFERRRSAGAVRTLIIGAGAVGGAYARVLRSDPDSPRSIAAYVDDDPRKIGRRMNGIPVWGPIANLPAFLEKSAVNEVVITTPNLSPESKRAITDACRTSNVSIRRASLEAMAVSD
jgi:UDP-GlcNAc:undecaprenyl-phosphate GlcNAc-1-phosphate transferase